MGNRKSKGYAPRWNNPKQRKKKQQKKRKNQFFLFVFFILFALFSYALYIIFQPIGMTKNDVSIFVKKNITSEELYKEIDKKIIVRNPRLFKKVLAYAQVSKVIKEGRYTLSPKENIFASIRYLKSCEQSPIIPRMNYARTQDVLLKALTENLKMKTSELSSRLSNPSYCKKLGFDTTTVRCIFSPDLVERWRQKNPPLYWNIAPDSLISYFKRGYDKFWNKSRKKRALEIGLRPYEVVIMASIVQEEARHKEEYPKIAGLYMNRFRKGFKLQADPTVRYAYGDFSIKRVGRKQLKIDSPYNTYRVKGLPPGPICFPSYTAIDAVLYFEEHNFIYMCANADFSGYHLFTSSYPEHCKNARAYQRELDRRNITK